MHSTSPPVVRQRDSFPSLARQSLIVLSLAEVAIHWARTGVACPFSAMPPSPPRGTGCGRSRAVRRGASGRDAAGAAARRCCPAGRLCVEQVAKLALAQSVAARAQQRGEAGDQLVPHAPPCRVAKAVVVFQPLQNPCELLVRRGWHFGDAPCDFFVSAQRAQFLQRGQQVERRTGVRRPRNRKKSASAVCKTASCSRARAASWPSVTRDCPPCQASPRA